MDEQKLPLLLRIHLSRIKDAANRDKEYNRYFVAFWLGVLSKKYIHYADEYYYSKLMKKYATEDYNRSGLRDWEKKEINKYFMKCKRLLVAGAGAGREILGLHQMGFDDIDGFECHPELIKFGNELLKQDKLNAIQYVPRDQCPDGGKMYDGIIIGWGAYTLIKGRKNRVDFLKKLRARTSAQSPILLSYFLRDDNPRRCKTITRIGNTIKWFLRMKTDHLEFGDDLLPTYVHSFKEEDLATELREGGFELILYSTEEYAHAVGLASK